MKGQKIFRFHLPFHLSVLLFVSVFAFVVLGADSVSAQSTAESPNPDASNAVQLRIERARALAAAHKLETAANELESLRNTTGDDVVRNVTSVMLMNICLEEGNYARAESLLEETFRARSIKKDASIRTYFALAGQAVNGARAHVARYRTFGINVTDAGLPSEALSDLDRLRSLLERMIAQAKEAARDEPRAYESLALLEDVLGIRLSLARNDEDREKWESEYARARRGLASSETQIASMGGVPSLTTTIEKAPPATGETVTPAPSSPARAPSPASAEPGQSAKSSPPPAGNPPASTKSAGFETISTGSLNTRAIQRVVPTYPQIAKAAATQGLVRVYVTVDETGKVLNISRSEGPGLLKGAAEDAARKWRFAPTEVDGKLVRVAGYIEFTFTP